VVLAWAVGLGALLAPLPEGPRAAVRPVARPPSAVAVAEREPEPVPAPAEPAAETSSERAIEPRRADVAHGESLLSGDGAFPALHTSYEGLFGFGEYAAAMQSRGARFVVVRRGRVLAGIDPETGHTREVPDGEFSPRARDYTGEPALAHATHAARERFGSGAAVMLLVPRTLDAGLFGGIARALADRGDAHDAFRFFEARYTRTAQGGFALHVDAGERLDGRRTPLALVFDLDRLSGGA
jgi:hypothetical protein